MTIKKLTPEELLGLDKFVVDEEEPHILLDKTICAKCMDKPCLVVCPAVLYTVKDGEMNFDYAGCLECGTCRVICKDKGIVRWTYPRGTFGVAFRNG
ncbi:ferredoxin family protein [Pelosinus fermentans]|uniref:4Fe-4S ferredoxin, iron-sulpur binding domain-containing protein n=1 Tax=Pelosinus fermentans JBW45 TaxID=1192197 RepID=I9NPR3_9FIRM|nr:4Fe-4S dicluster domain-containing protein [Pelosinus fermentans]AJQ28606.1 4Fe-4S ferredoxin, iron-sulpur binding domain-containing protein [Pelosinus fermentans JBW45]